MKTVRFSEVVKTAGAPDTYLRWMPVKDDKVLQRALKDHRILTVHQELHGGKKDFGLVGLHEEPNAQLLVFPKSLRRFEERRVIGINYDLMAKPSPAELKRQKAAADKLAAQEAAKAKKPPTKLPQNDELDSPLLPEERISPPAKTEPTRVEGTISTNEAAGKRPPEKSSSEGREPRAVKVAERGPTVPKSSVREIERALKELRAGKTVAAYERLEAWIKVARGKTK